MDEQSVRGPARGGVGRAAACGFVATALTLSLMPSIAYATPENEGETGPNATNTQPASPQNEVGATSKAKYTYDLSKIADGTYTGTATADSHDPLNKGDAWDAESYDVTVSVTVASGKITKVAVADYGSLGDDDWERMDRAVTGYSDRKNKVDYAGVVEQLEANGSTDGVDTVSTATISSNAILAAVNSALQTAYDEQNASAGGDDNQGTTDPVEDEYAYGYAALSWSEYWAAEGVYAAGDAAASSEEDSRGETDKGAFDAVSRATTNHGLHRGSFQCDVTIYGASGAAYELASWEAGGSAFRTTDGQTIGYAKGTLTLPDGATDTLASYKVNGLKYVPVAVKAADLDAFKAQYDFVANGEELAGGYSEQQLKAYTATAAVDADTNGLKTATKSGDSFSFSAAQAGTTSGIEGAALKTADLSAMEPTLLSGDKVGSYGEFIRLDFKTGYGDLGANLQSVTWTYYGNDASCSTPLATFGTKFAADNWMHRSQGIQLGLTDSLRCQLPEGTDGTGYWKVTVHALGYADASYTFNAAAENVLTEAAPVTEETKAALQALVDEAKGLTKSSYSEESWTASALETELAESEELLAKADLSEAEASEQITHLQNALDALVKIAPEAGDYILMNIPYDEFYAAETQNNDVAVDVFTSATKNKVRTGGLAGGSYHIDNTGDAINGITYPVRVTEDAAKNIDWSQYAQITDDSSVEITVTNRGQTSTATYSGKNALFEAADYAYYLVGADEQANYKELTADADGVLSFSAIKGAEAKEISGTATLTTDTAYGDYELDFTDDLKKAIANEDGSDATVYAVVVNTTDGTGYGMRHLENIWRTTELAWCTGFTNAVHNCPTSSDHYKSMMGKTIDHVTYYTSSGVYKVDIADTYVPIKADSTLEVQAEADADAVAIAASVPFANPAYTVDGEAAAVTNGSLDISGLKPGVHTLVASDPEGKYADVSCDFVVSTTSAVAEFDGTGLVAVEGASADDLANYVGNITGVSVNGKSYAASGRGSVKVINPDGSLNLEAASNGAAIFDGYGDYEIVVTSAGYPELASTVAVEADKTSLSDAIKAAEAVTDEGSYTSASWQALQSALAEAQKVAANTSAADDEVADAASALTSAQAALVQKATDEEKEALQGVIDKVSNQAGGLNESDYTAESWKALQDALAAAQALIDDDDASASDVAAAQSALTVAYDGLTAASADDGTDGKTPAKTDDGSDSDTADDPAADDGDASGSPKTGDGVGVVAGAFATIAAAAAGAAAFARRKFMGR